MSFHLHKFPLVSKSRKLFQLIPEPAAEASREEDNLHIILPNFESAAKFRYGVKLDLTATKVVDVTIKFLFELLRTAGILRASKSLRTALERTIGLWLEEAKVDDLLMPSYSELVNTLYDVECAERILRYFLDGMESGGLVIVGGEEEREGLTRKVTEDRVMRVGKLINGYLAEVASDLNLGMEKFCEFALAVPDHSRIYDDGL